MKLTRREVIVMTAGAAACACAGDAALAADAPAGKTLDIGHLKDYPADGVSDKFARSDKMLIVRRAGKIYVVSAICTHKSCVVKPAGNELRCPCHGSRFSVEGTVNKGPAPAPLSRFGITKTDGGRLKVDKSKVFRQGKWDEDGAFVKV